MVAAGRRLDDEADPDPVDEVATPFWGVSRVGVGVWVAVAAAEVAATR
jgi:hypothetical protein